MIHLPLCLFLSRTPKGATAVTCLFNSLVGEVWASGGDGGQGKEEVVLWKPATPPARSLYTDHTSVIKAIPNRETN
ncbi:hypothetical protein E2C01_068262 [Portunus trituberculatus]|uniref:Secreted protein n=1 Tax=Portunus trituberculatus TaxID=210409 RepID=A0A5B7HW21_PORTR|nr:hypothetical protein [Portunus trituberculatus]